MVKYEIKPQQKIGLGFGELVTYRELFFFFTWRDIKVKYKQTVLGFAWAILQPLLMMVIFTVFFGRALKINSENIPYPVYVFGGLIIWNIFSNGLTAAANSMVSNSNIIKKIYFPRLIIPISSVLVAFFDFIMAWFLLIVLLFYYHVQVNIPLFLLSTFVSVIFACLATFGPGCLLAALNVKYRDFRYVIPFLVQGLLFVTPVIYPYDMLQHNWAKFIIAFNPMTAPVELFHAALSNREPVYHLLYTSSISILVFLVGGVYYFRRTEAYFADLA